MKRRCQDRVEFAHEWQRWRAEQRERAGTSYAGTDGAVLRELVQVLRVATASDDVIFFAGAVSKSLSLTHSLSHSCSLSLSHTLSLSLSQTISKSGLKTAPRKNPTTPRTTERT